MFSTSLKTEKLTIGSREFIWGTRTYLMGILNITPDSFSGDGLISDRKSTRLNSSHRT